MGKDTKIEWCHHSFNIAWGCVEASAGCDNCYARVLAARFGYAWGKNAERRTFGESHWREPLKWNRDAYKANVRARVFTSSMTDVFLNDKTIDEQRNRLWPLIRETQQLDWLILTKHPERITANLPNDWGTTGYPNVWLGTSVENEENAWRAHTLRTIPAVVRFISAEPLLGPLRQMGLQGIDWVICGGESGNGARPMLLDWARNLRDRCAQNETAFFLKQLGGATNKRGNEEALLDGVRHVEFPTPRIGTYLH